MANTKITNHIVDKTFITGQTAVTAADGDYLLVSDASDSGALKKVLASDLIQTSEEVQDLIGAMFSSNTETGIAATYQDGDGTIDLVLDAAQPNITSVGTLTGFTSTGIDDNADATAITIGSDESVDFAKGIAVQGSGTTAGVYLNGTNSDSITQGNFVRYSTNFVTQSNAANSQLITYAFNGSSFVKGQIVKSDGTVELYYGDNKVLNTASGALQISSHGTGGNLNLFSDSGTNEGQFNITYLTDGSSDAHSIAEIRMQQGSGDGSARKGEMLFRVSDNGAPSTALTIANNKQVTTAGDLIVGADIQMANGRGIAFSSTTPDGTNGAAVSETLDDYEEGTCNFTEKNGQATITTNRGHYVKIGQMVTIWASVNIGSNSNGNALNLTLPFTSSINGYYLGGGTVAYHNLPTAQRDNLRANVENAAADVFFFYDSTSIVTCSQASGQRIDFIISYRV